MKRPLLRISLALGILPCLWIGSYVALRLTKTDTSLWSRIMIDDILPARVVSIPEWMEPVKSVYRPLMAIDYRLTGRRVHLGKSRIHIGATADF